LHLREPALELLALGCARGVGVDELVRDRRELDDGVRAHAGDSSPHAARRGSSPLLGWASVKVSEISYDVDGWGGGQLWFDDAVLVWHELPSPRPDASSSGAPQPTTHCDSIV